MTLRSLAIQSIHFATPRDGIDRAAASVVGAARAVRRSRPDLASIEWRIGDCSPEPVLDSAAVDALAASLGAVGVRLDHRTFGENLGPSGGHNRLWAEVGPADALLLMAPDLVLAPESIGELMAVLDEPTVGGVEARQVPSLEQPRPEPYGAPVSWITGASSLVRGTAWDSVGGYDAASFFLYHNDVDLSWRLRDAGWELRVAPHAVVFNDKRPDENGRFVESPATQRAAMLGWLTVMHVWARTEAVETLRSGIPALENPAYTEALSEFDARVASGRIRTPRRSALIEQGLREVPFGGLS
ncbi:glycosyltransferase family protein [Microcella humidisoli]|uniref:Glycosyltransferase family 2 protein n=1 Tax=Microcella humidisoli TaxID=2963406 RepID=A0ABY5FUI8_9MICO|nr:hypothetical protein [Microcella humidisoli]UTT61975.1 hypothetical protein NNL39_09875 [Microcella humidisoli]